MEAHKTELLEVFKLATKDAKLFDSFLKDILTPAEYREMATRWQIVKQLAMGKGQREIARDLKIGISTVTRGSRTLENPNGGFNQLLTKFVTRR